MAVVAEAENPFLGAGLLLVATSSADGRIEPPFVEGLFQRLGFHHVSVYCGAMADRANFASDAVGIHVG